MCTRTHAHTRTGTREYTHYSQFVTTDNKQGHDTEEDIRTLKRKIWQVLFFLFWVGTEGGGGGAECLRSDLDKFKEAVVVVVVVVFRRGSGSTLFIKRNVLRLYLNKSKEVVVYRRKSESLLFFSQKEVSYG